MSILARSTIYSDKAKRESSEINEAPLKRNTFSTQGQRTRFSFAAGLFPTLRPLALVEAVAIRLLVLRLEASSILSQVDGVQLLLDDVVLPPPNVYERESLLGHL